MPDLKENNDFSSLEEGLEERKILQIRKNSENLKH